MISQSDSCTYHFNDIQICLTSTVNLGEHVELPEGLVEPHLADLVVLVVSVGDVLIGRE